LTEIIRRDFYPDIQTLEAETFPCDSGDRVADDTESSGTNKHDSTLSLDQFLNTHESEDDASFKEMVIKSNEKQYQKHAWLHEKEEEYGKLASEGKQAICATTDVIHQRAGLDSWAYTAKNSLMYIPDGVENSAVDKVERAVREREIVHSNTRLPHLFVQKFQQTVHSDGVKKPIQHKVGVDGKSLSMEGSPKVNGYGFLATPSINPGKHFCLDTKVLRHSAGFVVVSQASPPFHSTNVLHHRGV
jgi:protein DGCR14